MIKINEKNNISYYQRGGGYALLETLFYISLFSIFSVVLINSMLVMTKAFKETAIYVELMQSGNIMERISREIKRASSIYSISANSLKLNTKDDAGLDKTIEFSLLGSNARLSENDLFTGNLNTLNIAVVALTFTQINTAKGTAVKIFLTVKSNYDSQNRNENFYNTIVLRGDY